MHPIRRQRLIVVLSIVLGSSVAIGLVVYAMKENMNLFFTPSQLLEGDAPAGQQIRVGGYVVAGSVKIATDSLATSFKLRDDTTVIDVRYEGILPDLFAEEEAAIAKGHWDGKQLDANQVLAKHDENYTPPEIEDTMQRPVEYQ